jgi:hypothetical protein
MARQAVSFMRHKRIALERIMRTAFEESSRTPALNIKIPTSRRYPAAAKNIRKTIFPVSVF